MNSLNSRRTPNRQGGGRFTPLIVVALVILASAAGWYLLKRHSSHPPAPVGAVAPAPPVQQPQAPQVPAPAYPDGQKTGGMPPSETAAVPHEEPAKPVPSSAALLAVIIDDMGSSMQEARALADMKVPVTFSIIPGLPRYREVAAFAAAGNIETMLHIPMQSKGWPQKRLESNGLLMSMEEAEIESRVAAFMKDLPNTSGANNHMGSEFTEHEDKMRPVLEVLKGNGLFFIDSVTSTQSVALRMARAMSIRSARRQVFLDNEQNDGYIRGQIRQAVAIARKNGSAIAICHPHPATLTTLAAVLPGLEKEGITLVPASRLVK